MTKIITHIEVLREKLNEMMFKEMDSSKIYTISAELDNWIVKYYKQQ